MSKTVSYPIAKGCDGQWVHIDNAKCGDSYQCPECESPFIARLGSIKTHHFAHKSNYSGVCSGESGYHSLAKHMLAYHFEKEQQIRLISKCSTCGRRFSGIKRIVKVEVEKRQADYRPDARLFTEDGIVINCEIVFKHPLADKFNMYKGKDAYLLVWNITGQVYKVPAPVQYKWEEDNVLNERQKKESLILMGEAAPPSHRCTPYGIAYVVTIDCYNCHRKTKVALFSSWYPKWGNAPESGVRFCGKDNILLYVSYNQIPSRFWGQLNSQYDTLIFEDHSDTTRSKYLMNHCAFCRAKIDNHYLEKAIMKKPKDNNGKFADEKVEISFPLTEWETQKLACKS